MNNITRRLKIQSRRHQSPRALRRKGRQKIRTKIPRIEPNTLCQGWDSGHLCCAKAITFNQDGSMFCGLHDGTPAPTKKRRARASDKLAVTALLASAMISQEGPR